MLAFLLPAFFAGCEKADGVVPVQGLSVKPEMTMTVSANYAVQVSVKPENANGDYKLIWTSSDPSVAVVAADGTVTAVSEGQAVITASLEGNPSVKTSCKVHVEIDASLYVQFADERFEKAVLAVADKDGDGMVSCEEALAVKKLVVSNLYIKSLAGIEYFENLEWLDCSMNLIKTGGMDLSRNRALRVLDCSGNNSLKEFDVTFNTALVALNCKGTGISSLDVSKNTELTHLNCYYNNLTSLDLSRNTALEFLSCGCNQFTELDLTHNTALKTFECTFAKLETIDLSRNTALESIDVRCGVFKAIDVRANKELRMLHVQYNHAMSSLDVSQNTKLRSLCTAMNAISSLDLSKCPDMDSLWVEGNGYTGESKMTELDLSNNSSLVWLRCAHQKIKSLKLAHTKIDYLECNDNALEELTVPSTLTYIKCSVNRIPVLDLSGCASLTWVECAGNGISELKVNASKGLMGLLCGGNRLTSLDLSGLGSIWKLECHNNRLTSLDISANKTLKFVKCTGNTGLNDIYVWNGFDPDEMTWDQGTKPCYEKDPGARWVVKD